MVDVGRQMRIDFGFSRDSVSCELPYLEPHELLWKRPVLYALSKVCRRCRRWLQGPRQARVLVCCIAVPASKAFAFSNRPRRIVSRVVRERERRKHHCHERRRTLARDQAGPTATVVQTTMTSLPSNWVALRVSHRNLHDRFDTAQSCPRFSVHFSCNCYDATSGPKIPVFSFWPNYF